MPSKSTYPRLPTRPSPKDRAAALRTATPKRDDPSLLDVELLALGRLFDDANAAWLRTCEANREPLARYEAFMEAAKARGGPTFDDHKAAQALPGVSEAGDVEETAFGVVGELSSDILARRVHTPQGLALQARAAIVHIWPRGNYQDDAALGEDEDMGPMASRLLIESCCALAGVDWRGAPAALSAKTASEPQRRDVVANVGAPLTGAIVGVPPYRIGRDLSAVAEGWIDDARELGLLVMKGSDGELWRVMPTNDSDERQAARERHWIKLNDRPPLMRAVRAAVARGFRPEADREHGEPARG